jgi:recombinational DNA repair ATPase RecF
MTMDQGLHAVVASRLEGARAEDWGGLVLAALAGFASLEAALAGAAGPRRLPDAQAAPTPSGTFLQSITVEGFRGIGPARTLDVTPGPGLTLVVGRNGSGKSSFAEAFEVLLTGDSLRWKERAAVWREGWRNLHHAAASITATFLVEGERTPCVVSRRWAPEADFGAATIAVQRTGEPGQTLDALGWAGALQTHRPFLSYNELGSLLDEGPSKLYDALSAILGLEDLVEAQRAFQEARRAREKAVKDATDARDRLLERLRGADDVRAGTIAAAVDRKEWDLDAVASALAGSGTVGAEDAEVDVLRRLARLEPPDPERTAAAVAGMRDAAAALRAARGTAAARSRDAAALLELAIGYHATHGDGDCPVCGRTGALDAAWSRTQRAALARLRKAAQDLDAVHQRAEAARRTWADLVDLKGETLTRAAEAGLDLTDLVSALGTWARAATLTDLDELADHVEAAIVPLREAIVGLRGTARAEVERKEDAWRPIAVEVATWLAAARTAVSGAGDLKRLKPAEAWLKKAAAGIRDDRFAPIAEKAAAVWEHLRQQSHVELGRIQLTGDGTRRRVVLDVTVDGVAGAALGVMSQGELHSLALSLFVPRATLPESPFRFILIDDPVQSMDPARVDGLARVLERASADRQVLVFTHDDRLPEAVRRLDIAAEIVEVARRDASVVELRRALDPVGRHLEDAFTVASTANLPAAAATRVVPGLCRLALEAACVEVLRRRRLSRGESHAEIERALRGADLTRLATLAVFDDEGRAGDVLTRLAAEAGPAAADTLQECQDGTHDLAATAAVDLVRRASKLAAWLQGLR